MLLVKHNNILLVQKCFDLLDINCSTIYYKRTKLSQENIDLMNLICDIWLEHPFYGYRKLTAILQRSIFILNHKKVLRLM